MSGILTTIMKPYFKGKTNPHDAVSIYTPYLHVLVGTKLLIYYNIWFVVYGVTIMVSRE